MPQSSLDAVIISNIHLGCDNCQAKLVIRFLEDILAGCISTRRLIINGEVFDSIDFRRLKKTHWKVLSMIRHLLDKMKVIWTCGNHYRLAELFLTCWACRHLMNLFSIPASGVCWCCMAIFLTILLTITRFSHELAT
jgi:hypothetical protein